MTRQGKKTWLIQWVTEEPRPMPCYVLTDSLKDAKWMQGYALILEFVIQSPWLGLFPSYTKNVSLIINTGHPRCSWFWKTYNFVFVYQLEYLSSHCVMASNMPPIMEEQRNPCDDFSNEFQQKEESKLASHEDVPAEPVLQPTDGANKTSTSTSRDPSSTANRLRPAAGTWDVWKLSSNPR